MSHSKMNPDIKEERDKVSFHVEEFTNLFFGGVDKVNEKRFLENFFLKSSSIKSDVDTSYLSHKEKYEEAIRRISIVVRKIRVLEAHGLCGKDIYVKTLNGLIMTGLFPEGHPLVTHIGMFVPGIANHGSPEQIEEWYEKARTCKILGSYVQTEFSHGTFVRGLQMTATYDPKTKEFVLNTPSIEAYKIWPGGLGHTVNHAIVLAQLWSLGKCHGLHPFIVQLRDLETHKPLDGIQIGDIGNKFGFNAVNNGFLAFNNFRIPLKNMLMKNAKILENGEFVKTNNSILTYATMTHVRVLMLYEQAIFLALASTVATRYSMVRKQSPINPGEPEPKIIEHVTQQYKVFPLIAKAVALKVVADNLNRMYVEVIDELNAGDLRRLPELHALSCCLKAVTTDDVVSGIQTCRLACGGHGYLNSAGFNSYMGFATAAQHYEGENTIMLFQTARQLMKSWQQALQGEELSSSVDYLKNYLNQKGKIVYSGFSTAEILRVLQATSAGKIANAFERLNERSKVHSITKAFGLTGIELAEAARSHCYLYIYQSFLNYVEMSSRYCSTSLHSVLVDLLNLFAVDLILKSMGNVLQFVEMSTEDIKTLEIKLEDSMTALRNNAIGICDGFDFPDEAMKSVLGAYDGNVYERLLEAAKTSPLNQEDVNKSFHLYLKPLMKSNL